MADDTVFGEGREEGEESGDSSENDVMDWAESNFKAVKNKIKNLQTEMRNAKPQENINVRKVDTEEGERIVVEYSVQRWYSPKYFRKMLESDTDEMGF